MEDIFSSVPMFNSIKFSELSMTLYHLAIEDFEFVKEISGTRWTLPHHLFSCVYALYSVSFHKFHELVV